MEKRNEMWKTMEGKIDVRRDSAKFWKEIDRMMGRRRKGWTKNLKNEQGEELRTEGEVAEA